MTTLKERIEKAISELIYGNQPTLCKDVYFHKTIIGFINDSVHLSFRFYNKNKNYFVFSLTIQLKDTLPIARYNVSLLCPKRYFLRTIRTYEITIEEKDRIPNLIDDVGIKEYYKFNRKLPSSNLYDKYLNLLKEDFDKYFKEEIENGDLKW